MIFAGFHAPRHGDPVGCGKADAQPRGIAGRMFTTLAQGNINIAMISQGANEINISCVIDGRDAVKALNLIHQSCLQIMPEALREGVRDLFNFSQ